MSIPDNAFPSTLCNRKHVIVGTWLLPPRKLPHMPNLYRNHNARMQPRENIIFLDMFVKERTLETIGDYFSVDWWQVTSFSCTFAELGNALAHPMCRRSIPFIQWQPQRLRSTLNLFKYLPSKQSQKQSLRVLSVLRGLLAFYMENFQLFAFKTKPEAKQKAKSLSVRVLSVLRGLLEPLKPIFPFLGLKFWSYFKSIIKEMSKCILRCSPSCSKAFSLQNSITLMLLKPIFCFNRSQIHIYTENFWYSILKKYSTLLVFTSSLLSS